MVNVIKVSGKRSFHELLKNLKVLKWKKTRFHEKYFKRSKRLQKCNNTYRLQVRFFGTEKKMPFYMKKNYIFSGSLHVIGLFPA